MTRERLRAPGDGEKPALDERCRVGFGDKPEVLVCISDRDGVSQGARCARGVASRARLCRKVVAHALRS